MITQINFFADLPIDFGFHLVHQPKLAQPIDTTEHVLLQMGFIINRVKLIESGLPNVQDLPCFDGDIRSGL